jgi:hypothetical protein
VQYTAASLAVLENKNFHVSNLRFNSDAYLLHPSFSVRRNFPYVYREFIDRRLYPESRMAYRDQTMAMPWSMPGLVALALAGSALPFVGRSAARTPLLVLWGAALPTSLAMLTAVAVTQRYTADFGPFLIVSAAFGISALEDLRSPLRAIAATAAAVAGLLGIAVTLALSLHNQREIVWGVPEELRRDYQEMRVRVDTFFGVAPEKRAP